MLFFSLSIITFIVCIRNVKASEYASIITLNSKDILFQSDNCLLFIFKMANEDIKVGAFLCKHY